jgi:S-adenosylmethionine decarboxylase
VIGASFVSPSNTPTAISLTTLAASENTAPELDQDYLFWGRHFIASYNQCNPERLASPELITIMREAIEASGASLLSEAVYAFPNAGLTAVFLLSESHASIHTYPEHAACFVDLFTCGERCRCEEFDAVLRNYLLPQRVDARVMLRHESNEDQSV